MNYYERHLGDYAKDTAHLSMVEHGAYTLLLDRYYGTEQAIPADQVYRVARARTKDERDAVDTVLREFFTLNETQWVHERCDDEIAKAHKRITAARTNGVKGGRPKTNPDETQEKPDGFEPGSNQLTQSKALQSPVSIHQTPEETPTPSGYPPLRGDRASRLPDDWELTADRRAIAETEHLSPERTFEKFRDHWRASSGANARKRDWDAAWRNWCRTEADRSNGTRRPASAAKPQTAWDRVMEANRDD